MRHLSFTNELIVYFEKYLVALLDGCVDYWFEKARQLAALNIGGNGVLRTSINQPSYVCGTQTNSVIGCEILV